MNKQKIGSTPIDKTDRYLRTQKIRIWIVIVAAVVLVVGALVWLFFGSINIKVTGYAQVLNETGTYCVVPSEDIDKIKAGMTVWVDDTEGKIIFVGEDYYTYDGLLALYGYSIKNLHVKENEVYYFADTDIIKDNSSYSKFTIIVDTVTPFEYYFGEK